VTVASVEEASRAGGTQGARTNVVLIVADDMGWGDLGCYGATKIPTPAMDALAAEGLRATDCHAASALCTPSRYAILTGRYAWRSPLKWHVLFGHAPSILEPDRPTLASVLRQAGYATGAFGKWHLGIGWRFKDGRHWSAFDPGSPLGLDVDDGSNVDYAAGFGDGPIERGFDRFFGITGSLDMQPYCYLDQDRTLGIPTIPKRAYYPQQKPGYQVDEWREEEVDARFTAEACSWMTRQARSGRPFLCYLPLSAPHRPCMPPEPFRGASAAGPRGDMVCVFDDCVGKVTALLDTLGVAENTVVIATSDNGAELTDVDGESYGHLPNGPWRGQKADIWEGGHRQPFIARWPGRIAPGTVTSQLFGLIDLLPTLASATGAALPAGAAEDGMDVLDVLASQQQSPRSSLVHHSGYGVFGLRAEAWKLAMGAGSGGFSQPKGRPCDSGFQDGQLYDLVHDPAETRNLWSQHRELVEAMYEQLKGVTRGPGSGLCFDVFADPQRPRRGS
jgi:arylsulfatase A